MDKNNMKYDDKLSVKYKDRVIDANLIFRSRKNITIQIRPVDNVIVISPKMVSKKIIKEIIIEKGDWILEKLDNYKGAEDFYKEKNYLSGDTFFYLGREYTLEIIKDVDMNRYNSKTSIYIENDKIIIRSCNTEKEYIKECLKKWYKNESERIVAKRISHCRQKSQVMMKLMPRGVKVKEQKKRWGSCTSKKDIYINSRISMAKPEAIDYILVHEFSHLVHMNHSKDFYSLVKTIMPDYKVQEKWLKDNGYKLNL